MQKDGFTMKTKHSKETDPHRAILIKSILLIAVLITGVILLYIHSANASPAPGSVSTSSAETSPAEIKPTCSVRISGGSYLYQGSSMSLEELRTALHGTDLTVSISGETGDALDALLKMLEEESHAYVVNESLGEMY